MPVTMNFGESSNDQPIITSEIVNESGEIEIKAKWNNVTVDQTLPARPHIGCLLCFDKDTFNFYWQRLVEDDARARFEVIRTYPAL